MSHPNAVDRKSENGFSLVEVLTALVIAAFALVVLMRGLGTSQTTAVYLESHLGARLLARSILEDERQSGETKPGRRSGDTPAAAGSRSVDAGAVMTPDHPTLPRPATIARPAKAPLRKVSRNPVTGRIMALNKQ